MNLCDRCGERPIAPPETEAWQYDWCEECYENSLESAWERAQEEGFRGSEAESYAAEQQSEAQKLK